MEWYWILSIILGSLLLLFVLSILLYKQFFKRFWDIVLSLFALIVLSPLFIVLIIVGVIAMKGNPFFVQKRPGKKDKFGNETIFKLIKFRSMTNQKDKNGNLLPDASRLKSYGRFLRKTSLDELPELFNIFVGKMSLVGPRPQLLKDLIFMSDQEKQRHLIRPGLTGLAQIKGRNSISWSLKFDYDLKYLKTMSLFTDTRIILLTVLAVFNHKNVNRDGTVSDLDYGEWLLLEKKIDQKEYESTIRKLNY